MKHLPTETFARFFRQSASLSNSFRRSKRATKSKGAENFISTLIKAEHLALDLLLAEISTRRFSSSLTPSPIALSGVVSPFDTALNAVDGKGE